MHNISKIPYARGIERLILMLSSMKVFGRWTGGGKSWIWIVKLGGLVLVWLL